MKKFELKNRKGQRIVGILRMPDMEICGTAIIQHGYGGLKEQDHVLKMEAAFHDNGFITFNFDATNSFGESEGSYWEARLGLHAEDLEDVVKWVQKQEWFQKPLALTGHSMGGYAVSRYAENYPDEVSFLAPIAPVVSGVLSLEAHKEEDPQGLEEFQRRGYKESISQTTGILKKSPWAEMEERLSHDLLPNVKNIIMPTLLVAGSSDKTCRPKDIKMLYEALPVSGKNRYFEIKGAPHTYRSQKDLNALYNAMSDWIRCVKKDKLSV